MPLKPYSSEEPSPYDLNTYYGRVLHFVRFVNPINALYTSNDIKKYQQLLEDFKNNKLSAPITNEELWRAKYVILSNVHPDSGKEIPRLFRMSAFVPTNVPIAIGLSLSKPTTFNIAFWMIANQSYNFGVNVCNANASNTAVSYYELTMTYAIAIFASISVSLFINYFTKKIRVRDSIKIHLLRIGPFFGTVSASFSNLAFSRYKDLTEGIYIRDEKTNEIIEDKSAIAGLMSFLQCSVSRVFVPLPVFVVPPTVVALIRKTGRFPKSRYGEMFMNSLIAASVLWGALALSISAFPQESRVHKSKLEPRFANLKNSRGEPIDYFVFNRGL